ncbi:adenine phosphoribosyltransferase [Lapidilactobacillus concavus DSM 17758]|uniref:Adenine phosphoribosyltransferase n=2 Tax=Lapidilactobacillus TaxID=2767884 RepID=A0A0R1W7S5_9LACO|nr:adenine phosphoribosyltransferase [Lapidilactobacillus concavus DSM 17758]
MLIMADTKIDFNDYIASIPDFPEPGIIFRDISPLMANGKAYSAATDRITAFAKAHGAEMICGPEARGFIVGCPVADRLGIGFAPARKKGKLPRETVSVKFQLEYGETELFMHKDAVQPGQKVLIVDDLLATGGTVAATANLVEQLGGIVVGTAFLIELKELHGRDKIKDYDLFALMEY